MTSIQSFDVIIIGAGIAGTGLAAELSETCRVLILERESHPGAHSTGRSAASYIRSYGGSVVRALSNASYAFFDQPPHEFSSASLLRKRGVLHIASAEQQLRLEAFSNRPDVSASALRVGPDEILRLCPLLKPDHATFGVYESDASDIDVHALQTGYLQQFRKAGGAIRTESGVDSIVRVAGSWRVQVGETVFQAPVLANAAGAWADEIAVLAGVRPLGLQPKRRTAILVDAPEIGDIAAWPLVIDADEQFYFKPDAGRLLLSPADTTLSPPCDAQPEEMDIAIGISRVEAATTLQVRRVRHSWAGLRSFLPDGEPAAGFDGEVDDFFWLAGQGGYGIQTAPALSRAAASLLLRDSWPEDLAAIGVSSDHLSPARFVNQSHRMLA